MKKFAKEKKIEKLIRSLISSLLSHLYYTHVKSAEGVRFHKKCIKDYASDIKTLSELL